MKTVLVIVLVIAAFYGGMQYEARVPALISTGSGAKIAIPSARKDFKNLLGEVVSVNGSTLTLKGDKGVMSTVSVTASTTISKNASLKLSDVKPGFKVVASGVLGSDGVVSAAFLNIVQDEVQSAPAATSTKK